MNLESPKVSVAKPASYIFEQLIKVENFEKLMPESIAKFEVTAPDAFIFGLKGMPEIKLKLKEQQPNTRVLLGAASDKLPFSLEAKIDETSAGSSDVQLFFEGEFNAMMAMMIKGPISKFLETLAANMHKL
ncbi:SRPBCC family protein [Flavobacterium silvaticum]|uniref:SRPBCC family protein n=1 Tax=Flavobacterium silvaticum TaxID=1852020 RepID=A0A972FJT8_9FLAO|nr:SRPBCC family protein [Flavobacterium silvaticum]NMH26987.1 SRPBCC family protein [Flavobacterium silvaticum]